MSKANPYDVVFWWSGGRLVGEWRSAYPDGQTLEDALRLRLSLCVGGRVAHMGKRSVGAPEGAPSDAEFESVGV